VIVQTPDYTAAIDKAAGTQTHLPTPEFTPEPELDAQASGGEATAVADEPPAIIEGTGDLDRPRELRIRSYATTIAQLSNDSAYHTAFSVATSLYPSKQQRRFHQSELPVPPRT
jgi:hypothetical protein